MIVYDKLFGEVMILYPYNNSAFTVMIHIMHYHLISCLLLFDIFKLKLLVNPLEICNTCIFFTDVQSVMQTIPFAEIL